MAQVIRVVKRPHDCLQELEEQLGHLSHAELWLGSIVECSCKARYIRREHQIDGLSWERMREPLDIKMEARWSP